MMIHFLLSALSLTFLTPLAYSFAGTCTTPFKTPLTIPDVKLMKGFPDVQHIHLPTYCSNKNVLLVGLPGAFTPT